MLRDLDRKIRSYWAHNVNGDRTVSKMARKAMRNMAKEVRLKLDILRIDLFRHYSEENVYRELDKKNGGI